MDKTELIKGYDFSRQDLEDLGWENLGGHWFNYTGEFNNLGYWLYVRLKLWGDNSCIIGYRSNPKEYPNTENDYLYQGKIKKHFLKELMYMINLHNQNEE